MKKAQAVRTDLVEQIALDLCLLMLQQVKAASSEEAIGISADDFLERAKTEHRLTRRETDLVVTLVEQHSASVAAKVEKGMPASARAYRAWFDR